MTPQTIQKIEQWAAYALNDIELCLYAWISRSGYYEYLKNNSRLVDRIAELRESPTLIAKINTVKRIKSWVDDSTDKRRLERKSKREFSKQENVEITGKDWQGLALVIQLPQKRDD